MFMPSIRPALPGDSSKIKELLEESHLFSDDLAELRGAFWVLADEAETAQGFIGFELRGAQALLRSAVVAPGLRGRGHGRALTHHALNWARQNAITRVYCFSTDAGAYWQRFGFAPAPVDELVTSLPDTSQVRYFERMGWLPNELAWRLDL